MAGAAFPAFNHAISIFKAGCQVFARYAVICQAGMPCGVAGAAVLEIVCNFFGAALCIGRQCRIFHQSAFAVAAAFRVGCGNDTFCHYPVKTVGSACNAV